MSQVATDKHAERVSWYVSAFEFHLQLRAELGLQDRTYEVKQVDDAPEFWKRLMLGASVRKFLLGSDPMYLPEVVESLMVLGTCKASFDNLTQIKDDFELLRSDHGTPSGRYRIGKKSKTAVQILEHLLHTKYLHAKPRDVDYWTEPRSRLDRILWEGTEQAIPLLNAVYLLSCAYLNREPVEESEAVPEHLFEGINNFGKSDGALHSEGLVDAHILAMHKVNLESGQCP